MRPRAPDFLTLSYKNTKVYAYGVVNILLDFIVWLMPIPLIWQLQLSFSRRLGLTIIFLLGLA